MTEEQKKIIQEFNRDQEQKLDEEVESLKRAIEFLEEKMSNPKTYLEWRSRMQPQLNDLKKELEVLENG